MKNYTYNELVKEAARMITQYPGPNDAKRAGEDPELVDAIHFALVSDPMFCEDVERELDELGY